MINFYFILFPFNFHILKSEGFYLRTSKTGIFLGLGLLLKGKLLSGIMVVTAKILFLYWLGLLLKKWKTKFVSGIRAVTERGNFCLRLGLVLKKIIFVLG